MTVVIVLLFANAHGCEGDVGVGDMADVVEARASSCSEAEVIRDNCYRGCACAPLWIGYFFEVHWVVVAPFRFVESRVGSKNNPICDGADKGVL